MQRKHHCNLFALPRITAHNFFFFLQSTRPMHFRLKCQGRMRSQRCARIHRCIPVKCIRYEHYMCVCVFAMHFLYTLQSQRVYKVQRKAIMKINKRKQHSTALSISWLAKTVLTETIFFSSRVSVFLFCFCFRFVVVFLNVHFSCALIRRNVHFAFQPSIGRFETFQWFSLITPYRTRRGSRSR